jgi:hypothetical protein
MSSGLNSSVNVRAVEWFDADEKARGAFADCTLPEFIVGCVLSAIPSLRKSAARATMSPTG